MKTLTKTLALASLAGLVAVGSVRAGERPSITRKVPGSISGVAVTDHGLVVATAKGEVFRFGRGGSDLGEPLRVGRGVIGVVGSGSEAFALVPSPRGCATLSHRLDLVAGEVGLERWGAVRHVLADRQVVASSYEELALLDTTPEAPIAPRLASFALHGHARASAVAGDRLYVASAKPSTRAVFSLTDRRFLEEVSLEDAPRELVVLDGAALVLGEKELRRIDLATREQRVIAPSVPGAGLVLGAFGGEALFSDGTGVLRLDERGETVGRTELPAELRGARLGAAFCLDVVLVRGDEVVFLPLEGLPLGC